MSAAHVAAEVITALGGLTGAGAIITSTAALLEARRVRASVEPNHGDSMADAVRRIEASVDDLRDDMRSLDHRLGHELGEVKRVADREHADHAERLRALEARATALPGPRR